jgi:iron-sulfur cluster repair protein YtfE (RIC family)
MDTCPTFVRRYSQTNEMEALTKEIEHIENLLTYLEETQHEQLRLATDKIESDLTLIRKAKDIVPGPEFLELNEQFCKIREEIHVNIKMERRMIFKHIRSIVENIEGVNAERDFRNLSDPVRQLILQHHKILDEIHDLLKMVTALGYQGYTGHNYLQTYIDLFEFYNFYNKQVYLEENMLFPSLANAFIELKK